MSKKIEDIVETVKNALQKSKPLSSEDKSASQVLIDKLKSMDSAYRSKNALPLADFSSVPDNLGLTPKTYTEPTEEELLEKAKIAVEPEYKSKKEKLIESTQNSMDKLETETAKLQSDYLKNAEKLNLKELEQEESHKNNMILQGLVHSSVNETVKNDYESVFNEQKAAALLEFEQKNADLENRMTKTQLSFEQALMQYDLQYAADLDAKLASLRFEQEKLKEQINAYNKKIAEQELKYQKERSETLAEMEKERTEKQAQIDADTAEYESKYGYSGEKAEEMERRYQLAYNTYSQMDKADALRLISMQSEALKETLGLYYQRLIAALSA
jgi:hypothetical protein